MLDKLNSWCERNIYIVFIAGIVITGLLLIINAQHDEIIELKSEISTVKEAYVNLYQSCP